MTERISLGGEVEKKASSGEKIEDLTRTPWGDITSDLKWFANMENSEQVAVENMDAKHAVQQGWLVVKEVGSGKYEAYISPSWPKEQERRKSEPPVKLSLGMKGKKEKIGKMNQEDFEAIVAGLGLKDLTILTRKNGHYELTILRKNKTSVRDVIIGKAIGEICEQLTEKYGS